ncbi:MAG: hypothetical protein A3C53_07955 [Omnitrophica WOR_2 bacterium RIFCSPHIGHO2_02_FULL_68_15]|nr:MAG: hypothetical protein A3C53_07955 [Omnitrophica WOR_2 bacterium RIFCSPHIGHO2_02_FULL_68_15]
MMLTVFLTVGGFFFFVDATLRVNHFWWPALSLIPAVVLAADGLLAVWRRSLWGRRLVVGLCGYLVLHLAAPHYRLGQDEPIRLPQEWVGPLVEESLERWARKDYFYAYQNFHFAAKLDPTNPALQAWAHRAYRLAYDQQRQRWRAHADTRASRWKRAR